VGITIITISKSVVRIVKTKPPIGSIVKPSVKRTVAPIRVVKRVVKVSVKAPTTVKIYPRIVVDVIDFGFACTISPRGLRFYSNISIVIVSTGIILSVREGVILWVVQRRIIIGYIIEIIFVINRITIDFGLDRSSFYSSFRSINTIGGIVGSSFITYTRN